LYSIESRKAFRVASSQASAIARADFAMYALMSRVTSFFFASPMRTPFTPATTCAMSSAKRPTSPGRISAAGVRVVSRIFVYQSA